MAAFAAAPGLAMSSGNFVLLQYLGKDRIYSRHRKVPFFLQAKPSLCIPNQSLLAEEILVSFPAVGRMQSEDRTGGYTQPGVTNPGCPWLMTLRGLSLPHSLLSWVGTSIYPVEGLLLPFLPPIRPGLAL